MQPEFWLERWRRGQTGFHQAAVDDDLRVRWPELALLTGSRVFVPLCGKSLDMLWLLAAGHRVLGVELSQIAVAAFFAEHGILARRRMLSGCERYEAAQVDIVRGDFFALTAPELHGVTAVYDRAALISFTSELRPRYAEHMAALTARGTQTLLVTLEYPQSQTPGPPFSVPADEVERLYTPHHTVREIGRRDILANEPRMRARGVSSLAAVCYRLTRL